MSASNKDNYQHRMKPENCTGETLFKKWCLENDWYYEKFGFDSKIKKFWLLNPILRNIPDYIIEKGPKIYVVQVKGTANFKQNEYNMMDEFIKCYDSKEAPLVYAFCFSYQIPVFKKPNQIKELYEKSINKIWDDGKIYRTLSFNN